MKVWIRADGNEHIGTGHVMRCLAIAEALEAAGVQVCFVIPGMTAWRRNCLY